MARLEWRAVVAAALVGHALLSLTGARHRAPSGTSAAHQAEWTDPSPHRVMRVAARPGVELEVLDWGGRGVPLVFLAGYGNTAHVFDRFAPQFCNHHHVVAITRRGFGASTLAAGGYDSATLGADVLAVIDKLQLDRPVLVAHSFGGAELNAIALRRPEAVRAFVYLDGGFDFAELYADSSWMHVPIPRPPHSTDDYDTPLRETAYFAQMTGPGYPEAEVRAQDAWEARLRAVPAFHADSLEAWLTRGTPRADFRAIRVPALAIYGVSRTVEEKYPWVVSAPAALRHDAARRFAVEAPLLARQRARFRDEVPGGRVVEIPGGLHYVYLSHPREVAAAIRSFVR
jgi:non-heme chloroperoxidase